MYVQNLESKATINILFRNALIIQKLKFICIDYHSMPRDKGQRLVVVGKQLQQLGVC